MDQPTAGVAGTDIPAPAAQPTPAAAPATPAATPPPAPAVQTVTIPLDQLQTFTTVQARLAQLESLQQQQAEAHQRELQNEMLRRGQAEEALRLSREQAEQQLTAERQRLAEEQRRSQTYAIDVEVARAMAPHQFASQIARSAFEADVRRQLIAEANGNSFAVRTPTYQTPEQVVAAMAADPGYAPFLAPRGVAGTQGTPTSQTPPAPPAGGPQPATPAVDPMGRPIDPATGRPIPLGQTLVEQRNARVAAMSVNSDLRFDPSRPMGLGAGSLMPPAR